ncbi:BQ5605_C030g10886 [Microbotryum silenes-dioicae]|uniref:BQ5605_C030g10865 protein n=1 Tax=Microbotryum silenes-dioicae TaxID=796604 RepID=A0A2X0NAZ8_9BASI|nr:BQ5605_C030g10865 [Microbotryum silenes-dioicae]SGZ09445.1 BQ5605_C030g10873 [Microbotryum silenes-dioicae]SGZ09600.1 BQ5605_C030g10886 [Microbotryum silenes-dioicae]
MGLHKVFKLSSPPTGDRLQQDACSCLVNHDNLVRLYLPRSHVFCDSCQ